MSARLRWTPRAQEDVLDIYETIFADNPSAAERMFDKIEESANSLAEHPRIGSRRTGIAGDARAMVVGNYLIFYKTLPDENGAVEEVEITRVVHGHQDLADILRR
jgi:toxin ParE1/3/4